LAKGSWTVPNPAALATAAAILAASSLASAESMPFSVRLTLHDCSPPVLSAVGVFRAVTLELKQGGVERVTMGASSSRTEAELDMAMICDSKLEAILVLATASGREREQRFRLDDMRAKDRPRALALMSAEFVRRTWPALALGERAPSDHDAQALRDQRARSTDDGQPNTSLGAAADTARPGDARAARSADDGQPNTSVGASGDARPGDARAEGAPSASRGSTLPEATTTMLTPEDMRPSQPSEEPVETQRVSGAKAPELVASTAAPRVSRARAPELTASGATRWFAAYGSLLWGGSVGLRAGRFAASAEGLGASRTTDLGTASVGIVSAGGAIHLWQWEAPRFQLAMGAGASLGVAWASASAGRAGVSVHDGTALYADVRIITEAAVRAGSLRVLGSLLGGRAAGTVSRAGDEIAGATGVQEHTRKLFGDEAVRQAFMHTVLTLFNGPTARARR